jgi:glutathione S-transferase
MSYKLYYFKFRGRGEQVRLMLNALDVAYEDVFLNREGLVALKQQGPSMLAFGSVPMLEDGDLKLAQGPVIMSYLGRQHGRCPGDVKEAAKADAITLGAEDLRAKYFRVHGEKDPEKQREFLDGELTARWLPAFSGLLEENDTGYFVGNDWTHADIAVWDVLDAILSYFDSASLAGDARVAAFHERIAGIEPLAAYLAARPVK